MIDDDPLIDQVVAERYRVVRKLGEGGMCAVYEAEHVKLKKRFALKRLVPMLARNPEALTRLELEGEMLAGLRHPNVVEISGWETLPDGSPCMILEFLHGAHLGVRLQRGPMAWDAIARIGGHTMSALALAHRNGITHRDLKPDNIYISIDDSGDERVKLLDFGVSKLRSLGRVTAANTTVGTPSYMAPEQARGETQRIGPPTDVWAMATILYEMATARRPFDGPDLEQTLDRIQAGRFEPLAQLRPDAPAAFVELVDRALCVDPDARIQTIEELRAGLRAALEPRNAYRLDTPVASIPAARAAAPPEPAGSGGGYARMPTPPEPAGSGGGYARMPTPSTPIARVTPPSIAIPRTISTELPPAMGTAVQAAPDHRTWWIAATVAFAAIAGVLAIMLVAS